MISYVWPEPNSSAAGLRDLNLIDALGQAGFEVVVASAAENSKGRDFCRELERQGRVRLQPIVLNDSSFDQWIAALAPVGVIYDRLMIEEQYGWRVRSACPQAVQILDTIDLHFLRGSREQAYKKGRSLEWDEDLVVRELSAIHRVDLAWLVSDFEKKLLENEFGVEALRLAISRFAYPKRSSAHDRRERGYEERSGFMFIGNFRHLPNLEAYRWLRREIWPGIRKRLPHAELRVFGAYPSQEVMEGHRPDLGFLVMGEAVELEDAFGVARVALAPLPFGAGIKGKISDAWWFGLPVATTPLGAEGMFHDPSSGWGGLVSNDSDAFIEAAVRLHEDSKLWVECSDVGRAILSREFSPEAFESGVRAGLEQAKANFSRRGGDWMRRMLTHHSLETPRYLSKWIEAKAKTRKDS